MKRYRTLLIWALAVIITLGAAVYQRMTGPTYPMRGKVEIEGKMVSYELLRSHNSGENCPIRIGPIPGDVTGRVVWKRYKTEDPLKAIPMTREGDFLVAMLPTQPPAGKLNYQIELILDNQRIHVPEKAPVVIRFKGAVPDYVLAPHIFAMFFGMLFGMRALLAVVFREKKVRYLAWTTLILFGIGGFMLGPLVQKFAFGAYWTGWPFGEDLTDNKTALALLMWVLAVIFLRGQEESRRGRLWVVLAAIVMFAVFMVPHSMRGSELDYSTLPEVREQTTSPAATDSMMIKGKEEEQEPYPLDPEG